MNLSVKTVSILGLAENGILSLVKLGAGFFTGSIAVLAEGIHSMMDVFSSLIAWWGIKKSEAPADKEHPYGHARYETVASFFVTVGLFIGGVWVIFEAFQSLIGGGSLAEFSWINIGIMAFSMGINEVMARLKFKAGGENSTLVLVADGQHDRADVIASGAILVGLFATRWIPLADALLALAVGLYIIYESFGLAKETIELLVDTANLELEEKIKKLLKENKFNFKDIKTRKIGNTNSAEIELLCNPDLQVKEVDSILKNLEKKLLDKFEELSQVSLIINSHNVEGSVVRPNFWGRLRQRKWKEQIVEKKKGKRAIIPIKDEKEKEIFNEFGAPFYFVVEKGSDEKISQKVVKNPYYSKDGGKGARFARSVEADIVFTKWVSQGALNNLEKDSIEIEKIAEGDSINDVIKKATEKIKEKGGDSYAKA